MAVPPKVPKTYVVEHLDAELGPWSTLEYIAIAQECSSAGAGFYLSSVPATLDLPYEMTAEGRIMIENRSIDEIFKDREAGICLLDPGASDVLHPDDALIFDIFLFGGILGRYRDSSNG